MMKIRYCMPKLLSLALVATLGGIAQTAWAAQTNIFKCDTATMNTTNDWSFTDGAVPGVAGAIGVIPGTNYVGYLTSTLSSNNAANMKLGGNIQIDALYQRASGSQPALTNSLHINADGNTLSIGTAFNGTVGFQNYTAVTNPITVDCPIVLLGNNQNTAFRLQPNATITVNGSISSATNMGSCMLGVSNGGGTANLNGGGTIIGTYFGVASGTMNINSNLTLFPSYRFVVGYAGNTPSVMNISNCTITVGTGVEVDLSAGYNGVQTSGTGTINIGGSSSAPGLLDFGQTTGTFKIGVATGGAGGSGTLNLDGYGTLSTKRSLTANTLAGSANINFNGGTLQLSGAQGSIIGANVLVSILDGGAIIDTQTNSTSIVPAILSGGTGIGGLTKLGTGNLTLANNSAWGGPTAINGGELTVSTLGFNNASSVVTVAANATNGVQKVLGGATWSIAGLTYASGNTWLDLNFSATAGLSTAPITVNGNLAINGTLNVIVRGTALWAAGTYPLIKYTGSLSLTGSLPATPVALPAGVTGTIVNDPTHKSIDLVVTVGNGAPAQVISWAVNNGTWDINTTPNWDDINGNLVNFLNGQATLLNDGATLPSPIAVELDSTVNPAGVTVNNTLINYTIQGSGTITGTNALTKSGTSTLVLNLANGNSYSGGTFVQSGTLQISADNNLGATTSPLAIGPDATATLYASGIVGMARPVTVLTNANIEVDSTLYLTNGYTSSLLNAGTVNVNGGGTIDLPANTSIINSCFIDVNNATVQLDGGTVNAYEGFAIGNSLNSVATLTVNSGTFNLTNTFSYSTNFTYTTNLSIITTNIVIATNYVSGGFTMADNIGVNSTLNVNGGVVNFSTAGSANILWGNRSQGTINIIGGTLHINPDAQIYLGGHPVYNINNALGTLNITGPGALIMDPSTHLFNVGTKTTGVANTTGIINLLSGGLLQTGRPIVGGNATSDFHFSGGKLTAGANMTNLLQHLTLADIDGNGATIDDGGFIVSIPQPLVDAGGGYLTKNGNGTLYLDGTNTYGGPTVVTAGTLGGSGTVASDLTLSNNAALAPGDKGVPGTLTVGGNLTFNGNVLVKLNTSLAQSNDLVAVTGLSTNNGTGSVIVTNLGPTLVVGDQFYLFSQPVTNGNALTVTGGGATWANNLAVDGSISVLTVVPTVNTNPATANFHATAASGALNFTWAPDHLGWQLYTNSVGLTASSSWFPVAGSAAVTNQSITINPANSKVFFQLRYP